MPVNLLDRIEDSFIKLLIKATLLKATVMQIS